MLELVFLLGAAIALAGIFIFAALKRWRFDRSPFPAELTQLTDIIPLSGICYEKAEQLFNISDYEFLRKVNHSVAAREFERDRIEAVLLWLKLLREDVTKLHQFHRTLVGHGVRTDALMEWRLLIYRSSIYFLLPILSLWIRLFGLYTVPRLHALLLATVRYTLTAVANLLGRSSPEQLAEVKQAWISRPA